MFSDICNTYITISATPKTTQSVCLALYTLLLLGLCFNVYKYLYKKKLYAVKTMTLMYIFIGITIVLKLIYQSLLINHLFFDDDVMNIW